MTVPGRRAGAAAGAPPRSGFAGGVIAGDGVTFTCVPPPDTPALALELCEETVTPGEAGKASINAGGSEAE